MVNLDQSYGAKGYQPAQEAEPVTSLSVKSQRRPTFFDVVNLEGLAAEGHKITELTQLQKCDLCSMSAGSCRECFLDDDSR